MSYIYKIDGTIIKTDNLIENFNICIGNICISDENKKIDYIPVPFPVPAIESSDNSNCPVCTSCDTIQCPVIRSCPVCDVISTSESNLIDSKLTEPYIINEIIFSDNGIDLLKEYLKKLSQFNINFIKKYCLYSNFSDVEMLVNSFNFLNLNYEYNVSKSQTGLIINLENLEVINSDYGIVNKTDIEKLIPEDIKKYFEAKNTINIPNNIEKIKSHHVINIEFSPKASESTSSSVSSSLSSSAAAEAFNNLETYENEAFNITGVFEIEFYDLEINEIDYRYLAINLSDSQRNSIYNALEFHIPFEVSLQNNNLPPEYFKKNEVLLMAKKYLQKLFTKPDYNSYIYFEQEYSINLIDSLKDRIEFIEYNENETNNLVSQINQNKQFETNKFRNLINPDIYGDILEIKNSYKFTFDNIVYKTNLTHNIMLEEIKDNKFFMTFNENWTNVSNDIKLDDILLIRKGDNDTAHTVNEKYFNYWKVIDIYNSTYTLEQLKNYDLRNDVEVDVNYEYVDAEGTLPMPNNFIKAKEILTRYNLDDYDIESIKNFGLTISELSLSSSTRAEAKESDDNGYISGRDLMESINELGISISISNDIENSKTLCNNLLTILQNSDFSYVPITVLCDNDPNIIIIKFFTFYIFDLKLTDYKTYRFLRI